MAPHAASRASDRRVRGRSVAAGRAVILLVVLALSVAPLLGCEDQRQVRQLAREREGRLRAADADIVITPSPDLTQRRFDDVPYATRSEAQKLDLYLPKKGEGPFPVVIWVHGGGFVAGDKRSGEEAAALAGIERGFAVLSINYRLLPEAPFPAQIQDVKAAVRWVRANASDYALDPSRVAVWGGSAGGHLAALAGTSGGVRELDDLTLGNAAESSDVQAVVDWFGPTDLGSMGAHVTGQVKRGERGKIRPLEAEYLNRLLRQAPEVIATTDPLTYAGVGDPPVLIQHGRMDHVVPLRQSSRLAEGLRPQLGPNMVTYDVLEKAGHGGMRFNSDQNVDRVFDFLDEMFERTSPKDASAR